MQNNPFYVIAEPCVGVKDKSCVAICPVDCIQGDDDSPQLYINPDECIHCGLCEPECPVDAIFAIDDLPERWRESAARNAAFFTPPVGAGGLESAALRRPFRP